jgi:hypothetical protein
MLPLYIVCRTKDKNIVLAPGHELELGVEPSFSMHSFPHAIYRFAPAICPFAVQEKAGMHPI